MARPSKRKIEDNPLRQLRSLKGTKEKPIPQHELARIVGMSVNTLRSIEAGSRPLGKSTLQKIEWRLGLTWDQESRQWICRRMTWRPGNKSKVETSVATGAHIEAYRAIMEQVGTLGQDRDRDAVKMRIDALFDQIPKASWMRLLGRIQSFLDQLPKEFSEEFREKSVLRENRELRSIFAVTAANTFFLTNGQTDAIRGTRSYPNDIGGLKVLEYRKRMAKKYAELTKHVRPDGSWVVKFLTPGNH